MGLDTNTSTIGAVSLGAQGFGLGASTVGAFYSAQAQKDKLKSDAATAEGNARLAELAAQSAILQGQREEQKIGLKYANIKGAQKASLAANGVDIASDTAQNILTTTDTLKEIDANTEAANAARSAWGYRIIGTNYSNSARSNRSNANAISPFTSSLTSLINGVGSVGKSVTDYNKATEDTKGPKDTSAAYTDPLKQYGPFDNSLPWRNTPTKALY